MTIKMDTNKMLKLLILGLFAFALMFYLGKQCANFDIKHKSNSKTSNLNN